MTIDMPASVWKSVEAALRDYLRFGPGDLDAEHIPDGDLVRVIAAIERKRAAGDAAIKEIENQNAR